MSRHGERWTPLFEGITTSARVADLPSDAARVFYCFLLTKLDDWGKAGADPRKLNATVWPMLGRSEADTAAALKECREVGLIEVFSGPEGPFLVNVEHEDKAGAIGKKDHRRASKFPEHEGLAPIGPEWPEVARSGPRARTRASGARARADSSLADGGNGGKIETLVEIPPILDTPDVRAALAAYHESRKEQGHKPLKRQGLCALYGKLARWGPLAAVASLQHAAASGNQGCFYPKDMHPQGGARFASEQTQLNIQSASRLLAERREHLKQLGIEDTDDDEPQRRTSPGGGNQAPRRLLPVQGDEHRNGGPVPAGNGAVPVARRDEGRRLVQGQLGQGGHPTDRDAQEARAGDRRG